MTDKRREDSFTDFPPHGEVRDKATGGAKLGSFGETKATNPKDALGSTRVNFGLLSPFALAEESLAMEEGGVKYGYNNYRIIGVRTSIYVAAAFRHIWKYVMGEVRDPETGVHHIGYARACLGIIIDAENYGKLTDDRPPSPKVEGGFSAWINRLENRVKHVRSVFGKNDPKHYTIKDSEH